MQETRLTGNKLNLNIFIYVYFFNKLNGYYFHFIK